MSPLVVVLLALAAMVFAWFVARSLDGGRIETYLRGRGCELTAHRWMPFGRGWLGSAHERIYAIRYRDRDGAVHSALAKTSMLAGVYLSDDEILVPGNRPGAKAQDAGSLQRENDRLRAENAALLAELERLRRPQG